MAVLLILNSTQCILNSLKHIYKTKKPSSWLYNIRVVMPLCSLNVGLSWRVMKLDVVEMIADWVNLHCLFIFLNPSNYVITIVSSNYTSLHTNPEAQCQFVVNSCLLSWTRILCIALSVSPYFWDQNSPRHVFVIQFKVSLRTLKVSLYWLRSSAM